MCGMRGEEGVEREVGKVWNERWERCGTRGEEGVEREVRKVWKER